MKRARARIAWFVLTCLTIPFPVLAGSLSEADALYDKGGMAYYLQAIAIYENLLTDAPTDFTLNWKCASAHREYGETAKKLEVEGWKKVCAEYGKKGMTFAAKAIEIQPDHPAGHYYYGLSVGIYADGTGVLTAIKEGLKNKTQKSLEQAYALDKMYEEAGGILALGRFWAILPWPLAKKKEALEYYREYQATPFFQNSDEARVYLAELLIDMGGSERKAEAGEHLAAALKSDDAYFKAYAERLMASLK